MTLLDTVDEIDNLLSNGILHIDQTEIPAPWMKLLEVEKNVKTVDYALNDYLYSKDYVESYNDTIIDKVSTVNINLCMNCFLTYRNYFDFSYIQKLIMS